MANTIHKGNYVTIGITLTNYDGAEDTTTPITVGQAGSALLVEPAAPGPGNRQFYVSIPPAETQSKTGLFVSLSANIPATGGGAGAPSVTKSVNFTFDTVVPIDNRAAAATGPTGEQPLPHP